MDPQVDRAAEERAAQDWLKKDAECLTEAGFPTTYNPVDGSAQIDKGIGQEEAFAAADAKCIEELGGYPTFSPFSTEELNDLYDQSVAAYECLQEQGLNPSQPISREQFHAAFPQPNAVGGAFTEGMWYPHEDPETHRTLPDDVCPKPSLIEQ